MSVFDKFTLPQSVTSGNTDTQIIPINDNSWGPSTPGKSTRVITTRPTGSNINIGGGKLIISGGGVAQLH